MKKEKPLSEKRANIFEYESEKFIFTFEVGHFYYPEKDVKQFIKEILAKVRNLPSSRESSELYLWIKQKAGDLVK